MPVETGASDAAVAGVVDDADALLADNDWNDWEGLSAGDQEMVLAWKSMLDDYNNGIIGPGHCDDNNGGCDKDKGNRHRNHERNKHKDKNKGGHGGGKGGHCK